MTLSKQAKVWTLVGLAALGIAAALCGACLGSKKLAVDGANLRMEEPKPGQFPYDLMDQVQAQYVDEQGLVDYDALDADPKLLLRFIGYLQKYSPSSHPQLFPSAQERLAYYVNAYNAFVLYGVLQNYPGIQSVTEVKVGGINLATGQGFFYGQRFQMGGQEINLKSLEDDFVRASGDARVHAAINCASFGCPLLPRHAFHPATLDQELDAAIRAFLNERRNVLVDAQAKKVVLSKILSWYASDFTAGNVLDYVLLYAEPELKQALSLAKEQGYSVEFRDYDWSLNLKGKLRPQV